MKCKILDLSTELDAWVTDHLHIRIYIHTFIYFHFCLNPLNSHCKVLEVLLKLYGCYGICYIALCNGTDQT